MPQDLLAMAQDAYIYGYPLVTTELTRRVMTNVAAPDGFHAPMGQFVHMRKYPAASFREVTTPNADTLYSSAWIDVAKEPYILSLPDAHERYYLMPMLDAWTTVFAAPGTRTTGTAAQKYAITGPGWRGTLPDGVEKLVSPTSSVWIIGRIYCSGSTEDYAKVRALQDQITLVPLSFYGKPYTPPLGRVDASIDVKTPVRDQVDRLDGLAYFALLTQLMQRNPKSDADEAMLAKLKQLGTSDEIRRTPPVALGKILAHGKRVGKHVNGWDVMLQTGAYGTDFVQRAYVTWFGLGANLPEDAVYPRSEVDAEGQPYSGANNYVMHFGKGELPPANAFWSLTMYDAHYFFVDNVLDKHTVSPRNNLTFNADGSLDLYVQQDPPGPVKQANWLPAPGGKFVLVLRMYWPKPSVLNGQWTPPPVERRAPEYASPSQQPSL